MSKSTIWTTGRRKALAMFGGVLLYGGLSWMALDKTRKSVKMRFRLKKPRQRLPKSKALKK